MMDEVIAFDKSLKQRLEEYNEVFSVEFLPSSYIRKDWIFFLEMVVDVNGWQALWKIPRLTCEKLEIPFPSVVLVLILNVEFKNLNALVRVLAVQDEITIPEKNIVPLLQLWPTNEQDKSIGLNIFSTANALDMYRFFYLHVYMPWDRDEDDNMDWKSNHLESRLRLYYDMKNGSIPRQIAEHIHSLLTTARRLQNQREVIEQQLKEYGTENDIENENKYEELMEINVKLIEIRSEVDMFENPVFRDILIKRHLNLEKNYKNKSQQIWVISDGGAADDYIKFLQEIKKYYPTENLTFSTNLASRLEVANSRDIFLLNEAKHSINTTGALETGGVLRGIGECGKITLTSVLEDVMLDFIAGEVLIENVTIDAKSAQCAILIRRGTGIFKNCKIIGDGSSSTHQGIIVLDGAEVRMLDCDVSGFHTSVVGNSGSIIIMENCEIHNSVVGIKLFDNTTVNLEKLNIHDCHDYGIVLETQKTSDGNHQVGGYELFDNNADIIVKSMQGSNNGYGNAAIHQKTKLVPIDDLFSNPNLDPTVIESGDEDMDCGKTVIERCP